LTLEIANLLEANGKKGTVKIIDGSPQFLKKIASIISPDGADKGIQTTILVTCARLLLQNEIKATLEKVFAHNTWDAQLTAFAEIGETRSQYTMAYGIKMLKALVNRFKICVNAEKLSLPVLQNTSISLIRPTEASTAGFDEDYGLGKYCSEKVNVSVIAGNHASILRNDELLKLLNN
jgi:hypothetical protein